jgi:phage gp16-like protein
MPEWLSPKLAYEIPLWLLSRPQQAVFRGAKQGADTYGSLASKYESEGYNPVASRLWALLSSYIQGTGGAASALNPWSEDVSGSELTEDFTGNRWVDKGIGIGLDLLGDPVTPLTAGVGKILGTAARTARNLSKIRKASLAEAPAERWAPTIAEGLAEMVPNKTVEGFLQSVQSPGLRRTATNLKNVEAMGDRTKALEVLDRLGWKKYLKDVPVTPRGNEPVSVREAGKSINSIREALFNEATPKGYITRGLFRPSENMMFYNTVSQAETVPHELTHWASHMTPTPFKENLEKALHTFARYHPDKIAEIRAIPSYKNWDKWKLGEELAARKPHLATLEENPFIDKLLQQAQNAIQPEMFRDAWRIPLEIPYSGAKLNERY